MQKNELYDTRNTKPLYTMSYKLSYDIFLNYYGRGVGYYGSSIKKASQELSEKLEKLFRHIIETVDLNPYFVLDLSDDFAINLIVYSHETEEMGKVEYRPDQIDIELYFSPEHWEEICNGMADLQQKSNLIGQMFTHEVLHFLQINQRQLDKEPEMWGFDRSRSQTGEEISDYFGQPVEIEAYANNAAHQLLFAYDNDRDKILSRLRTSQGIEETLEYSNTTCKYYELLRNKPGGGDAWQRFLKELYRIIMEYTNEID